MDTGRLKKTFSSRIGFSVISNAVTLLVSLILFRPYWEEIDDIWIAAFTEGAFGDNEPHVLFSNIIYGKILCFFQKIIPSLRWHAIFELFFAFTISVAFVYVLSRDRRGKTISIIFLIATFYEIYVALQFSKIPAYIGVAGYMILFELCSDTEMQAKTRRILCITSWIALFYAMMLRSDSFLLATMIAGVYGIIRVISEMINKEFLDKFRNYCLFFAPVTLLFIMCAIADRIGYLDPEWSKFRQYQGLESSMIDLHNEALVYNEHGDELKSIGVSENDAFMLVTWQFGDDEFLTEELINKIVAIAPQGSQKIDTDMLKAWIANIHETIFAIHPLVLAFVMIIGVHSLLCTRLAHTSFRLLFS